MLSTHDKHDAWDGAACACAPPHGIDGAHRYARTTLMRSRTCVPFSISSTMAMA